LESGTVTIERRLGGADASDLGIRSIMARYDLEDGYPEPAVRAAEALALDVEGALQDPLRRDVRGRFALTIDPVDARDFDDAICVAKTAHGGFTLSVHIADVSHYVMWDDPIDLEARRRATSVYLADRVLPMLPERLSNDLCSLRPGEDRLAMTVDMVLDANGALKEASIYPSVMRSRVRLSYDEAQALLDGVSGTAAEWVARAAEEGVDLVELLHCADELARLRTRVRERRGAVDFDTVEVHALLDEDGEPSALTVRKRTAATGLVEEAMLLANECVAAWLARRDLVAAYRVHEQPSPDHLHAAATILVELGIIDRVQALAIAAGEQAAMRAALADAEGTPASELVNALLLRAMQRAVYRSQNMGHYALGAQAYCHFTSPIRRYPDLMVHRVLKFALARERLGAKEAHTRACALTGTGASSFSSMAPQLCRACSERERVADAAARASQKVEVARFYANRLGERFAGTVSWVDALGAFVRIDETQAEGLIHMRDLGDEWFDLDERTLTLTGSATGRRIRPGDRVIVEIRATDELRGHLDLALVESRAALHW
uniref:ribonuclease R family protein n=1 Tax=Enorma sp. TaxID=1920692 RepID=UPI003AB46CDB